jgi:alpha-L-rhamnosidase
MERKERTSSLALGLALVAVSSSAACAARGALDEAGTPHPAGLRPTALRCEWLVDPLGIDVRAPRFSWEVASEPADLRDKLQTAYQVLVADAPEALELERGTAWDSGKVASTATSHVVYAGAPLESRARLWWKVRVWDESDRISPWSATARFTIGLLEPSDWSARWIGDATPAPPTAPANNGFHGALESSAEAGGSVTLDLGRALRLSAVRLHPARPFDWVRDEPGFLFPVRFRVEVSDDASFERARAVVDCSDEDQPNPGSAPQTYPFEPTHGRFVRLVVTRLAEREAGVFAFALAELEALAASQDVALGARVSAPAAVERPGWSLAALTDGDLVSHGPLGDGALCPPVLRREFRIERDVRRALLYVTALGLVELELNGVRVGDRELAPEWTDYAERVQVQATDVTALVHAGDGAAGANVLGATLGDGWYAGRIGLAGIVPGGPVRGIYGRRPALLAQLELQHADGSLTTIASDGSWRSTLEGPVRSADLLDGQVIDARRALRGWSAPGFDDSSWTSCELREVPPIALVAQPNEPIRAVRELAPIALTSPRPGAWIFDLGQNMVGRCRLRANGEAGTVVTLRHGEMLTQSGELYVANLRGAAQTDRFVLSGAAADVFEPRFTFHGFRYVEVAGLTEAPRREDLVGIVLQSDARAVGRFACSDPALTRLWQNIRWTLGGNLLGVPTDCPQRDERLGWMGDMLAFAPTACAQLDLAAFFTKWMRDVRDAQADDGRFGDFAPHPFDAAARCSGAPGWADAGTFVPWTAWVHYGDERLLAEQFEAARRWVDFVLEQNPDLVWRAARGNDYGDWLNADTLRIEGWPANGAQVPKDLFATAFLARSLWLVARMAEVLGRAEEAQRYGRLAADARAAFQRAFLASDGALPGDTQAGYALALAFDLVPESLREVVFEHLLRALERYASRPSTGVHATRLLLQELTAGGRADLAWSLVTSRALPSWLYPVEHGATTVWERWDGWVEGRGFQDPGMNSFAHYAFGSVGEWMMRTIVGIAPDPHHPGFERFVIRPRPGGDLAWAEGSYHSLRGRIACAWKRDHDELALEVEIPPTTRALVHVPCADLDRLAVDGVPVLEQPTPGLARLDAGEAIFDLGSGRYAFHSVMPPDAAGAER